MADDPQSSIIRKKDGFAPVIYGHTRDAVEGSYRVRVLRIRLRIARPSEIKTQRELQVPLPAAAGTAAFYQYLAEGFCVRGVEPNIGGPATTAGAAPVRMVPDVVRFGSELKPLLFPDWKFLE